jgi:hypothetical protein
MTNTEKILLLGGVAAAALGYYLYTSHTTAQAAITALPPAVPPTVYAPGGGPAPPVGTSQTPSGVDATQLSALMQWATRTKNPPLYQSWLQQLNAQQISGLYDILTTDWNTGSQPSLSQTMFWNGLVGQYPFLRTGGVGCSNFQCT